MNRLGMFLLISGGLVYTIMPYLNYRLCSAVVMTAGYFIVKKY